VVDDTVASPEGELVLRTLALPRDTNPNGDIFGGWLLSQMDIAGGLAAKHYANNPVVTVAIEAMTFHLPVFVGDVLCCYAAVERIGRTSMAIRVEAWAIRRNTRERVLVTDGVFTYVAVDQDRKPRLVPEEN